MSITGPLPARMVSLPTLARALEARYPGVRVTVKRSISALGDRIVYRFYAPTADTLVKYGLAEVDGVVLGRPTLRAIGAPEIVGCGGVDGRGAYVFHRLDDGEPFVGIERIRLRKTVRAVERIWKRISAPRKRTRSWGWLSLRVRPFEMKSF